MGLFSRALRAINAALNSWYSTATNGEQDKQLIGNVWVNTKGMVFIKEMEGEKSSALLTITATNESGNIKLTNELIIKPGDNLAIKKILEKCATGTITWSKVGKSAIGSNSENTLSYYASIKDWDGKSTELYQIKGNTYGLSICIDTIKNELYVKAENESYQDIHVYVIGYDGSDYDFDVFDLAKGEKQVIEYPGRMDELLPINRISIWFKLNESQISNLLNDKAIQERLDATLTRLGISEQ